MMRKVLKYTVLFTLASLIFYGGAGVNLMNYCCGDCLKAGIEAVLSENCCSTHHHDEATDPMPKQDGALLINGIHDCGMERIEFSWTTGGDGRTFHLEPLFTDVLFPVLSDSISTESLASYIIQHAGNDPPPIRLPREYLTLLTVLLI